MLNYRKFRKGNKCEVDEMVKVEKQEYPMRIVYGFGISHEHPGTFILTYIRSTNPHHEYIGLYPKGFKLRKRMFEDMDRLVAYFQKHIDDPQHDSAPSIRSVAAMVPMRSPATGSSGDGGGWRGDRSGTPRGGGRGGGGREHPSGAPRPYGGRGRGRGGRGRGRSNDGQGDSSGGGGGGSESWGSFPGNKVQNSPGKEAFPGGWGASSDGGGGGGGGWSSGGGGGWSGGGGEDGTSSGGGWGGSKKASEDGWSGGGGGGGW